ncbi:MAG: hypothetical protein WC518_01285 [Patescibacteria group bacterium]
MMIKKHYWAFILAIIVGVLYLAPQLFFIFSLGDKFQGVYRTLNDDELYYMSRAQEVVDGHYLISNPYFAEYKNSLPMQVFLPDLIIALPAKLLGISVGQLYTFYDFLFPAVLFTLTYFIFYLLTKNRLWSLVFGSFLLLIKYFYVFNRPMNPQFVFIFVLSLILLWLIILSRSRDQNKKNNWLVVLAGINLGLLFNFYTYFWTYFVTIIFILLIYFLYKKDFYFLKKFFGIGLIGLVVGIPYFYQAWQSSRLIFFQETIQRIGLINTRLPSGIVISFLALLIMVLFIIFWRFASKRGAKIANTEVFLFLGTLAALVNMNQHLITGKNIFFSSHYDLISFFFIGFSFVYLLWRSRIVVFLASLKALSIVALLTIVVIFSSVFSNSLKFDYSAELNNQRYASIFDWLNDNTTKDSVVMTDSVLSEYLPAYTHNNVFFNFGGVLFFVSNQEILNRFVLNNFWRQNFNEEFVKENFKSVYGYQYDAQGGRAKQVNNFKKIFNLQGDELEKIYFPPDKIKAVIDYYHQTKEEDWAIAFKKYQIDYLAVDETITNNWQVDLKKFSFLRPIYEMNKIKLYQVDFTK